MFDFHDFKVEVEDNALQIMVTNNGWGTAYDCLFHINEPTLNLLFTDSDCQYTGTIKSGESQKIFHFSYENIDLSQIEKIEQEFKNIVYYPLDPKTQIPFEETIFGIELRNIKCKWRCKDEKGNLFENKTQVWDWLYDFLLTQKGFCKIRSPKSGAGFPSEVTYSSIIDPTRGSYDQVYSFTRKIPPGDVERFHILIGSPISCHLLVRFEFHVDQTQVIESEVFDIKIWNPRNSAWHYVYKDGVELYSDLEKQQSQARSGGLSHSERENLRRLEQKVSEYPFFNTD